MKRTWKVLLVCVVAVAALAGYFFLLPAPAGRTGFDGVAPAGAAGGPGGYNAGGLQVPLEESHGGNPLEADTVTLLGANGESVILVGSQGRFAVDGYPLHDGETLLAEVQNILAS